MKKRILSIVLSIVMLVSLLPTTAWAEEVDPIVPSCTCGASADADGVILHVSDCPLYEATANESEATDPECTCGAVPNEDGLTTHGEDCPLYAGLEDELEEKPAEELAAPAVLERPYDEETSSDTVLYVDGQWDTYCWEIYTDDTFEWTVYADTAEIIVDKETYVASAFRCTVTLGDQSAVTEPAAYNTELIEPTVSFWNTRMASDRSAYMVWTKDDSVFNIRGLDGSYEFWTTFMDKGYRSWIEVDGTSREGTGGQLRDGLTYDITPSLVYGGRYVKITYTVVNTGSKTYTFRVGSAADVMIDNNDKAPVVGLTGGGGLVMSGSPKNDYTFNLVAPSADTLWYGYWRTAGKNVFNDREDKTSVYDKDSGMAWSWKDEVIKPGQTWERSVLIGVGELPVATNMPHIPSMPEFVAGENGIISGTATPGDTVYVTVDGEEYSDTADEEGKFSMDVPIPAEQPDNTLDVTYYAVSPEGGISEITSVQANVATAPRIVLKQSGLTLMEEDDAPDFNSFIADSEGEVSINSAVVNTNIPGTYTVTYTASVGGFPDARASLTVTVVPKPAELTAASCTDGSASFDLTATMKYTGGNTYTETGFVYAPYHYPTLTNNAGKVVTSSPVNTKDGTLSASVADSALIHGVSYYARPYAKFGNGNAVIYGGESTNFGLGVPSYGSVQISNNNDNTFTVSRTGGSEGQQIVHFRTVNGSAVGGTHFTHQVGTVTIPDGATTASTTISIAELGVNQTYGGKAATAYANADRTYQVEIYLVEGGASIGTGKATRTMTGNQTVNRSVYTTWVSNDPNVNDQEFRGAQDGYSTRFTLYFNGQWPLTGSSTYLKETYTGYAWYITASLEEDYDCYSHIRFTPNVGSYDQWRFEIRPGEKGSSLRTECHIPSSKPTGSGNLIDVQNFSHENVGFTFISGEDYLVVPKEVTSIAVGGDATGNGSNQWWLKDVMQCARPYDDREPQLLGIAPMADTTYVPGQEVTLALIFDEIVDQTNSSSAGLNSSIVLGVDWNNDNNADASFHYAGGLDTNVLYFTYTLPETFNLTGTYTLKLLLNNYPSAKIKDMCHVDGGGSAGYDGKTVTVQFDSTKPTVDVSTLSADEAGFTSGTITASNFARLEYVWSRESTPPVAGWESVGSGATVKTRQTEGTWYLHARATNAYGRTATAAKAITFAADGSGGTPVVLPELEVTVDNTKWVKEQRVISITTRQPSAATVAVTKPDGSIEDVSGNTYTATTNGIYTFTLTSGSETITKTVNVTRIDYIAPAVAIEDLTNFTHTAAVTLTVTAADTESGLAATPLVGVWKNETEEVAATFTSAGDGVWTTTSPDKTGSWVLTVTATDAVGRTSSDTSETYIIHAERPTITISNRQETDAGITYDYAVQENGNEGVTVTLPDGTTTTALTGTVLLTEPGSYYIFVTDALGHYVQSAEMTVPQSTTENPVDYTAPDVRYDTDPYVWTNADTVTVTLNIFEEQGLSSVTYRKSGETTENEIDISGVIADADYTYTTSFTVTENGTYTVTAKDVKGNTGTRDVVVDFIDRTDPDVSFDRIFDQWRNAEQTITLRPADSDVDGNDEDASGVARVEYAVSADKPAVPAALTVLENPYQVTISENGTWYIYYKITDNADNVATGWSEAVKVDKVTPVIAVDTSDAMAGAGEQTVSVTATFGVSGGKVTVGEDTVLTMESTAQSGTYTEEKTNTYVIRAKGVYDFVAASAADKTASQTVTVYGIDFDSNGGNEVADQIVVSGGKATVPEAITRAGYTFGGWYKDSGLTTIWDFENDTINGPTTIYAKWTEKNAVSITETAQTYTWDGNPKSFAITGTPNNEFTVQYKVNGNWTDTAPSAVGTYDVKITRAEDDTYKAYEKEITGGLVINAAAPNYTAPTAKTGLEYTGQPQTLVNVTSTTGGTMYYAIGGKNNPTGTWSTSIPTKTDAGSYYVWYKIVGEAGYTDVGQACVPVTIAPKKVDEPTVNGSYTYTGSEHTVELNGYDSSYMTITGGNKGTNADDYEVSITLDTNHTWKSGSEGKVQWRIEPATPTVTWPAGTAYVNDTSVTLTGGSATGVDGNALEGTFVRTDSADILSSAGEKTISVTFTPNDSTNYKSVKDTSAVTVSKRTVESVAAQAPITNVVYGTEQNALGLPATVEITVSGNKKFTVPVEWSGYDATNLNAQTLTGTLDLTDIAAKVQQPDPAITASIVVDLQEKNAATFNYENKTETYNGSSISHEISGTLEGVASISYSYVGTEYAASAVAPTNAGTYEVTATFTMQPGYAAVAPKTATLTINPKEVGLDWSELTGEELVYSGTAKALTATATGLADGDSCTVTVELVGDNVNVGTFSYKATALSNANYKLPADVSSPEYTITPKTLTITAEDKEAYVGSRQPELTYTIDGLVGTDTLTTAPTLSTDANMYRAGTYAITFASEAAAGNNYSITYVNGTLTVKNYPYIPQPTYDVEIADDITGGDVSASKKLAYRGDTITITVAPNAGYELAKLTVTDSRGNVVSVTKISDSKYTFKMPGYDVEIDAVFAKIDTTCPRDWTCPMYGYTDLDRTLWYHDGIHYCIEHGLMVGTGTNIFEPNIATSRAMIVTILWRLEGCPIVNYAMDFEDVAADQWYTEAIRWAASEKIVEGYGNGQFGTNDAITREQMVTIMFRYAKYKGYDVSVGENTNILSYDDAFDVAEWAIPSMQWACGSGMIQGIADGNQMNLAPQGNATRAQAAAILQRFGKNVANKE